MSENCKKLTRDEALEKINNLDTISLEEADSILLALGEYIKDKAVNLPEKVIGEFSYYEGEINIINIVFRLLRKLSFEDKETRDFKNNLLNWVYGKKYTNVDETSTEMTEEFEKEHQWELSRNSFINDLIKYIHEAK